MLHLSSMPFFSSTLLTVQGKTNKNSNIATFSMLRNLIPESLGSNRDYFRRKKHSTANDTLFVED